MVQSSDHALNAKALAVAIQAARAAASVIRDASPRVDSLTWFEKGAADFVTDVDRAAEQQLTSMIHSAFPDALILGEELTPDVSLSHSGLTFVADPLDGTTNFLHGYPHYAVSIAAMSGSEIVAAVVINVPHGDLFTAVVGHGAHFNSRPIEVSKHSEPSRALIGTGFPFKNPDLLDGYARQFVEVSRQTAGIRRAGSAALDLADVACGRFDGFWELILAPWDIAAGLLLIREAGGIVTDLDGSPKLPSNGALVAGNPQIHPWLLRTLRGADRS
ncbi:MAG: inositol monophosphatase family protein [Gemmatimonadales bacterium]